MIFPKKMDHVVIVYHRIDMDGVCSGTIASMAAHVHNNKAIVSTVGYDHVDPLEKLESKINACGEFDLMIVVDCTLPDVLLDRYAEKMIIIDHHDSGIERAALYADRFYGHCLRLNDASVLDWAGNMAKKAAACELAWNYFFRNERMPYIVRLCGRYDVYNHNDDTLAFNERCRDINIQHQNFTYMGGDLLHREDAPDIWFPKLFLDELTFQSGRLTQELCDGQLTLHYAKKFNARDCQDGAKEFTIRGTDLVALVANQAGRNSKFFQSKWDPTKHDLMIFFSYNLSNQVWKVGLFTDDKEVDMSKVFAIVLNNPKNKVNGRYGGHMRTACGYVTDDIQEDLLQYLIKNTPEYVKD
jgi:DHH family.